MRTRPTPSVLRLAMAMVSLARGDSMREVSDQLGLSPSFLGRNANALGIPFQRVKPPRKGPRPAPRVVPALDRIPPAMNMTDRVVRYAIDRPGCTAREIHSALGLEEQFMNTVSRALSKAERKGCVTAQGKRHAGMSYYPGAVPWRRRRGPSARTLRVVEALVAGVRGTEIAKAEGIRKETVYGIRNRWMEAA